MTYANKQQGAMAGMVVLLLTCEGLEGCQVVTVQYVHMAREGQVLAEAAAPHRTRSEEEAADPTSCS